MIPKTIHYIWLGGGEMPKAIKKYMSSWKILEKNGFTIYRWDEKNLQIDNLPEAINAALKFKKYAFAADYFRLMILYKHGGVYLDTDIEVRRDFTPLLNTDILLGFIYDALLGTAFIGTVSGNQLIKELIDLYNHATWNYDEKTSTFEMVFEEFSDQKLVNNNDLFTAYFLRHVSGFKLNGKQQQIGNIAIYPKEFFEGFSFDKKHDFTIHHCYGSWYNKEMVEGKVKQTLKGMLKKNHYLYTYWDARVRRKLNNIVPFADEYQRQCKCTEDH